MKSLLFLIVLLLPVRLMAQDCLGMPLKAGMGYEMQSFSAKDKPNGRMTYLVKDVRKEAGATVVEIEFQSFDEKDKSRQAPSRIKYTCTGNELVADLSGLAMGANQQTFKDSEMKIKANKLAYPRTLTSGQTLADGEMDADFYTNGQLMMEMSMRVTNRTVGPKESLTVPAGTFEINKVSADMEMKNRVMGIGIPASLKTVSYRAANQLFDIRAETYNKNGKLMGYTVLSKIY
ncbi:MAG: hypothetical protein EAZ91_20100 [Cytophagales bacterium]|nr:MAG: hypothetical protein EAZ91_20100 [Cytophagales bacterium]